jgi:hypothetical protein
LSFQVRRLIASEYPGGAQASPTSSANKAVGARNAATFNRRARAVDASLTGVE